MTEKELFCSVIRASLFPQAYRMPQIPREQYRMLNEMLSSHALTLLPAGGVESGQMPEPLREQWEQALFGQKRRFGQYLYQQDAVLRLFAKAEISCVVMKGAVSASYYPEPAYRAMGDIDLLVYPQDREKAESLLLENGFRKFGYADAMEQPFAKGSLIVEVHTGAFINGAFVETINSYLLNHLEAPSRKTLYGFSFPCLEEACNGLILLEHLHHHFRDRLGFRQVIDWMMYVDGQLDDDTWNHGMGSFFREFGLETFAITVTAMCQKYFGLRRVGISWTQGVDETLCDKLFDHIFSMGNFGRKLKANQNSAAGMLRDCSLPSILTGLQKSGQENWQLCHRHPWLRPFAWLYQIFVYLYRMITERYNMSIILVVKERRRVRRTMELMDKLGLQQKDTRT